jgi:hypothetical protein
MAEPLIPDPSSFKVEIAIEKQKKCKLPSTDQILVELFQAGGKTLNYDINNHIHSIWNKEELPL